MFTRLKIIEKFSDLYAREMITMTPGNDNHEDNDINNDEGDKVMVLAGVIV